MFNFVGHFKILQITLFGTKNSNNLTQGLPISIYFFVKIHTYVKYTQLGDSRFSISYRFPQITHVRKRECRAFSCTFTRVYST